MDALDRELTAALAVDPSPEFVARVRARIAREPAPSSWRMPRMTLAAGALAVVVVAVVSVGRIDRTDAVVDRAPVVPPVGSAAAASASVASGFPPSLRFGETPIRRHPVRREPNPIQLVSIEDLPSAPMGDVVPAMEFSLVTMTGVHP
jgi:hypothetical protein